MADTIRTIADILLLLADNTSGDISPQDMRDAIVSLEALSPSQVISATMHTQGLGADDYFFNGFYDCPAADSNLSDLATTQTYGTALGSYAAHAIAVSAGNGTTDGADLVLTVTGTSITNAGVRTTGDSEILVANCLSSAVDTYYESTKKWLGQVTYTLTSSGGTTFTYDFNYGFAVANHLDDKDYTLDYFEFEWFCGATDAGFDIELHHHKTTGWTYSAAAFVPGPTPIYKLSTDYSTDSSTIAGDSGKWKRTGLSDAITGSSDEGLIIHVTTTVLSAVQWMNMAIHTRRVP